MPVSGLAHLLDARPMPSCGDVWGISTRASERVSGPVEVVPKAHSSLVRKQRSGQGVLCSKHLDTDDPLIWVEVYNNGPVSPRL